MDDSNTQIEAEWLKKLENLDKVEKISSKQQQALIKIKEDLLGLKSLVILLIKYKNNIGSKTKSIAIEEPRKDDSKKSFSKNASKHNPTGLKTKTGISMKSIKEIKTKDNLSTKVIIKESTAKKVDKVTVLPIPTNRFKRTLTNVGSFKVLTPKKALPKPLKQKTVKPVNVSNIHEKTLNDARIQTEISVDKELDTDGKQVNIQETIDPTKLFECNFDAIDPSNNLSAEFNYSLDDIIVAGGLDNYDKMFFKELLEQTDDSEISELIIEDLKPPNQVQSKIFKTFLDYRDDKNKYFYNKQFSKILIKELVRSLEAKIVKIDQMKYAYVKKFGVLDLHHKTEFEYSFFSNFYLTTLEEEYAKIKDTLQINPILSDLLNIFKILSNADGDISEIIKTLKAYKRQKIPTSTKIKVEGLVTNDMNLFDPNASFKYNNVTGYLCHVIRDIVFYYGIVSNINFVLPEHYNTENYYKFLIEKRRFYQQRAKKLNCIIN